MMTIFSKKTTCLPLIVKMMADYINAEEEKTRISLTSVEGLKASYQRLSNLGLTNSANAKALKDDLNHRETINRNIETAKKLVSYVREVNRVLGKDSYLVSRKQFNQVCNKYNLVCKPLELYTGVIPEENIVQLENVVSHIGLIPDINKDLNYVTGIDISSGSREADFVQWIKSHRIIKFPSSLYRELHENTFYYAKLEQYFPADCPKVRWPWLTELTTIPVNKFKFFIAAPESHFKDDFKVTSRPMDPIVFQLCPYGVLVHSVWGEEADDETLAKYKSLIY